MEIIKNLENQYMVEFAEKSQPNSSEILNINFFFRINFFNGLGCDFSAI
jgi:hypothetical protein